MRPSRRSVSLPPPIFVLGARPVDVAFAGAIIGSHPEAFGVPELNLFAHPTVEGLWLEVPEQEKAPSHGLLRAVAYIYGCEQTIVSVAMAQRWVLRRLQWPTSRVFDELRERLAPLRLVDKSSVYSQRLTCLERIRTHCPEAYFVHVVEHPLTVSQRKSTGRRGRGPRRTQSPGRSKGSLGDQLKWLESQRRIADAIEDVSAERRAVLRMEDLITVPRIALEELCNSLGLSGDFGAVRAMLRPQDLPFARLGPVGANLGDDLTFLRNPVFPTRRRPVAKEIEMLAEVAEFAAAYGYN